MSSGRNKSPSGSPEDFRCSPWTAEQQVDPIGSAASFQQLVAIEAPLPWPSKIEDIEWLGALPAAEGTRVQLVVPDADRKGGEVLVTHWTRTPQGFTGLDFVIPRGEVQDAAAALLTGSSPVALSVSEAPPEVLICSHGSRDRCCGGAGTRLAVEARAALDATVRVRRTSHLGGHRFAPTAVTLPDGRCWSHLDAPTLVAIVERRAEPSAVRRNYRGNVGFDGPAQVAEALVLTACGWCDDISLTATAEQTEAGTAVTIHCSDHTKSRRVVIAEGDPYPILECGRHPDEAKKTAPRFFVADSAVGED